MAQTKRNQEKVVVTKIYFYGSTKIEQKNWSVFDRQQGYCCQDYQNEG